MIRKGMFMGDRYEIIDKVGSGGMSDVYKAKDHKLNRFVAIKVLKAEFSEDKNFVSKFKVEAQSAAGLAHPNIVNVFDVGEDNGMHYIVMEMIEGITLKKYVEKKGKLPANEAVSIAIQVAQGIEAAHNNHIIHRDIKPQNIIISREGKVKVTDFGIARAASTNTVNSNAMGSVHYISPEQARGGFIDEKSDIYSLGITLYEMLTGHVPFEGDTTVAIAIQHIQNEIPSPRNFVPDLPVSVERIIEKCTQKKADFRYLKVSSLIADLKHSLVAPNEDFVEISSGISENGHTVVITPDLRSQIRRQTTGDIGEMEDSQETAAGRNAMSGEENDSLEYDTYDDPYGDEEEDDLDDDGDDDIDAMSPKLDKIMGIGGVIACVVVIGVAIVLFTLFLGGFKSCNGGSDNPKESTNTLDAEHVYCPNVIGYTQEEAIEILKKNELGYKVETEYYNYAEEGIVFKQSEEKDSVIAKHSTITITVSKGGETLVVPDVTNIPFNDAKEQLEEKGLKVKTMQSENYEYNNDVKTGNVIRTDPVADTEANYGDEVTVFVSKGKETSDDTTIVPDIIGRSLEDATNMLHTNGLEVGTKAYDYDDTVPKGHIIRMSFEPNEKIPAKTNVDLIISLGREEDETSSETSTTTNKPTTTKKQPTTKKPTTAATTESTTEPTTAPTEKTTRKYTAKVILKKSDFEWLNEDGEEITTGTVTIAADGANITSSDKFSAIADWENPITLELSGDAAQTVTIVVSVDGFQIGQRTVSLQ